MSVKGAPGRGLKAAGQPTITIAPPSGVAPPPTDRQTALVDSPAESRWLDIDYYTEASNGFASYDPEAWLPTLSFSLSDFMFMPWCIISSICLALTIYVEVIDPERISWVDAPIDAHVILGGALSFLVVMRTDAS